MPATLLADYCAISCCRHFASQPSDSFQALSGFRQLMSHQVSHEVFL